MASGKLSKSTAKPAVTPKKADFGRPSTLSAEFVEDSDDDQDGSDEAEAASHASAPESSVGNSRSLSGARQSEDGEGDEGDESLSDSSAGTASQQDRPSGGTKKASGSDKRDQRSRDKTARKPTGKQLRHGASKNGRESEKSPEDESMSHRDDPVDRASDAEATSLRKAGSVQPVPTNRATFKPPDGFVPAKVPDDFSLQNFTSPEYLNGKQLWHIVAPSDVPISSITAATIVCQQEGDASAGYIDEEEVVASHKGFDYVFVEDGNRDLPRWAYAPKAGGRTYSRIGMKITRNIRLQHKSSPTGEPHSMPATAAEGVSPHPVRSAPQQPKGLKMRYRPFGVATEDRLSRIAPSSGPGPPQSPIQSQSTEKRKASNTEDGQVLEASSKKRKKHKRDKADAQENHVNGIEAEYTGANVARRAAQPTPATESTAPVQHVIESETIDGVTRHDRENETPEERTRRRAEKKRRKEEKLARKAERQAKREADA